MANVPYQELLKIPWVVAATQAMADGIARAIAEHKREGLPLAVWRDGEVVWISAEEAEAELAASLRGPGQGAKE